VLFTTIARNYRAGRWNILGFGGSSGLTRGYGRPRDWIIGFIFSLLLIVLGSRFLGGQEGRAEESLDRAVPSTYSNGCHLPQAEFNLRPCYSNRTSSQATIYLVGDSHAAQWIPGIEAANTSDTLNFRFLTKSSCPFVSLNLDSNCDKWVENVVKDIRKSKPERIIISNLTNGQYLNFYSPGEYAKFWLSRFESLLKRIPSRSQILLIEDTPYSSFDTSECLLSHNESDCRFQFRASQLTTQIKNFAARNKITYISFKDRLCPTSVCLSGDSLINYYRDENHISVSASKRFGQDLISQIKRTIPN
jgi:hypothetical protein